MHSCKKKIHNTPGQSKRILGSARRPVSLKEGDPVFVEDIRVKDKTHINSVRTLTGLYDMNNQGNVEFNVCNITTENVVIERGEILAVFDTLLQPPVEAFKPDYKHVDVDLDTIGDSAHNSRKWETVKDLFEAITIGPTTEKELTTLKNLVAHFIDAFAIDEDDIRKFTGFKYPLKLKLGAVNRSLKDKKEK